MEDRVIPDIMKDVFLPQGRYPKNFRLISQLEVCQDSGVKKGEYLEDMEDRVILDVMNHVFFTPRKIP